MIKVLINGATGKMGQEVAKKIKSSSKFEILCGVSKFANQPLNFPVYTNINDIKEKPDVIVDFSVPEGALNILAYAKSNLVPIVIATTGFSDEDLKIIDKTSKIIPIFKAANMSYEINLMADIASRIATRLKWM